jgi:methionyl-tRNA formyltransferase
MKVVYMGTPDFSVGALEAIINSGHEVTAVVTQPDKPKGRSKELQISPVKACALKYNLPVFQPVKIKEAEAVAKLREFEADIFVVAAFGQILSKEILTMPKYGCINIHASLLPKYRGASPIQWAVLNGEEVSGVTIMQMDEGIDTGDILMQETVTLDAKETGESLFDKLAVCGADLIVKALDAIEAGEVKPIKQDEAASTHVGMLKKEFGRMDFSQDAVVLERKIRGLNSWPSAYTYFKGKTLKIWDADVADASGFAKAECGEVVDVTKDSFLVMTGNGLLAIKDVQLEGKKRMDVKSFLLGNTIEKGMVFPN